MKKTFPLIAALLLLAAGCNNYDDFEFSGTVIDAETCTNLQNLGYVVELDSPSDMGGDYLAADTMVHHHVAIIYGSDRMLRVGDRIEGKIYIDNNYSKSTCTYHYESRRVNNDVPEACFTKLRVK